MDESFIALNEVIGFCRANRRVCPMPNSWNLLWEILPDRRRSGGGWEPALPLILAAWSHTSALEKMIRLEEHVRYAHEHGVLTEVDAFLRALPESEWLHT